MSGYEALKLMAANPGKVMRVNLDCDHGYARIIECGIFELSFMDADFLFVEDLNSIDFRYLLNGDWEEV